jgi:hypothetical protein
MTDTRRITSVNLSVQQTTHRLMREALCRDLHDAMEAGSLDGGGTGSIRCRACVVLYLLLCDHPVDRRGRCRSCRRPGIKLGQRRRTCRIHVKASLPKIAADQRRTVQRTADSAPQQGLG